MLELHCQRTLPGLQGLPLYTRTLTSHYPPSRGNTGYIHRINNLILPMFEFKRRHLAQGQQPHFQLYNQLAPINQTIPI